MSNESAAAIRQERRDWAAQHREVYLRRAARRVT